MLYSEEQNKIQDKNMTVNELTETLKYEFLNKHVFLLITICF